jgi:hypothetical protein
MRLICDPNAHEVSIYEQHNSQNCIKIPQGELSANRVKAIAYALLAMVEQP